MQNQSIICVGHVRQVPAPIVATLAPPQGSCPSSLRRLRG